eukprot:scaffold67474_cov31-Prasinocladus_malaysianus.AAC.4
MARLNGSIIQKDSRTKPGVHNPFLRSLRICSFKAGGQRVAIRDTTFIDGADRYIIPSEKALLELCRRHFPAQAALLPRFLAELAGAGHEMYPGPAVFVVMATRDRWGRLRERSLPSVLRQSYAPRLVVIADDNDLKDDSQWARVLSGIEQGESTGQTPEVELVRNKRTARSASGAWNTALMHVRQRVAGGLSGVWVAFLDDDDEWAADHLQECVNRTAAPESQGDGDSQPGVHIVVSGLRRLLGEGPDDSAEDVVPKSALSVSDFLSGNPGVQGSNLFVTLEALLAAGGFDESLKACTDRDVMIRLLDLPWVGVALTGKVTVSHYTDCDARLSTPGERHNCYESLLLNSPLVFVG